MSAKGWSIKGRWLFLLACLSATLLAAWTAPPLEGDVALTPHALDREAPGKSPPISSSMVPTAESGGTAATQPQQNFQELEVLQLISRRKTSDEYAPDGPFTAPSVQTAQASFQPAPAAPAFIEPPPPAPPQAPPLPFQVLGRYLENGSEGVFLAYNDQNILALVGETIAGQYKVEGLQGTVMSFRYLPLDQLQILDVGTLP